VNLKTKSQYFYERVLDWLLPPQCAGCGRLGKAWCDECSGKVRLIAEPICPKCGLPMLDDRSCVACRAHDYAFDAARAWAVYRTELRRAILSLKRRQNKALGRQLALHLCRQYHLQGWKADLVIAIPLATSRQRQRGYNQVDLLGRPTAAMLGLRYVEGALVRSHETEPQFRLNVAQRWENLHGAFQADPAPLRGVAVLLVDDIMTTGATLDAAAEALKSAGARQVFALTLTRALFESHGRIW
jgi:ComF family protein